MSGAGFVVALVISICCGGYVGVAYDRYKRGREGVPRPVGARRVQAMNPVRIEDVFWVDREGDSGPDVRP